MNETSRDVIVDCDAGRELGCATFCCRLLVRLRPEEMQRNADGSTPKGFVDKTEKGLCVHYNPENHLCNSWHTRPAVCREYCCNTDPLLQAVLRFGFTSIVDASRQALRLQVTKQNRLSIPVKFQKT